jgi:hypothetical protein
MILRLDFKLSTGQLPCNKSMMLDVRNQEPDLKNIYFFSMCSKFWNTYISYTSGYIGFYQYKYGYRQNINLYIYI